MNSEDHVVFGIVLTVHTSNTDLHSLNCHGLFSVKIKHTYIHLQDAVASIVTGDSHHSSIRLDDVYYHTHGQVT